MNFYALNEVPINGWDTLYGFGQAEMVLSAAGESANVVLGSGAASMSMQASGEGTRWAMGGGTAAMALQATGNGILAALGSGSASMELDASANGLLAALGVGHAALELLASGIGSIAHFGRGDAIMELLAAAEGRIAMRHYGHGYAFLELRAYDIPSHWRVVRGRGVAEIRLHGAGYGSLIAHNNAGAATMSLEASGKARSTTRHYGAGAATMRLDVLRSIGRKYRQINGEGSATMILSAAGRGLAVPSVRHPTTKARVMVVAADNRTIRVPRATRMEELAEAA